MLLLNWGSSPIQGFSLHGFDLRYFYDNNQA
jgi:hypothetical protein